MHVCMGAYIYIYARIYACNHACKHTLTITECVSKFPLPVVSSPTGLSALNARESGRMGRRALVYYGFTTTMAVITGVVCVIVIHPGNPSSKGIFSPGTIVSATDEKVKVIDTMLDILRYR